jgi:hypothetical protein
MASTFFYFEKILSTTTEAIQAYLKYTESLDVNFSLISVILNSSIIARGMEHFVSQQPVFFSAHFIFLDTNLPISLATCFNAFPGFLPKSTGFSRVTPFSYKRVIFDGEQPKFAFSIILCL